MARNKTSLVFLLKRALSGALFCLCLPVSANCPPQSIDETVEVDRVWDGDTLRLADGRKLRLIGINAPELSRDGQPAQPLAIDAKNALSTILATSRQRIALDYGSDSQDKYQRTLADIYLPDGRSVQALLLEQGLVTAFTTPPNDRNSVCYRAAEKNAMQQRRGLWALPEYQPRAVHQLSARDNGFRRITGMVSDVSQKRGAVWIYFGARLKVRIDANDSIYFKPDWLQSLRGKSLEIRGWLHPDPDNTFFMQLRHPDAITLLEPK